MVLEERALSPLTRYKGQERKGQEEKRRLKLAPPVDKIPWEVRGPGDDKIKRVHEVSKSQHNFGVAIITK